ncbi:class I SAM-dependent DNA methyltransferase [Faunimonas pinastri]|uniref:class I SAM-dependent DNA methyltransferase n=1 Tax=Faunimonas pinastri TaxID=1855383 RepID=UPI0015A70582|nr:class I SAM-dependent methyltransferase [Faunimonas pinastri]
MSIYDLPPVYDVIMGPGPCEPFYREQARRSGGPILELACGTGRLTIPVAEERDDVTGLDISPSMLASARGKANEAGVSIQFVKGDMRSFSFERRFGMVFVSCNSLAHLLRAEDMQSCLRAIRTHLLPEGIFVFDIVNPDIVTLGRSFADPVEQDCEMSADEGGGEDLTIRERLTYDPVAQIRTAHWRLLRAGHPDRDLSPLHLRQIFPQELPMLLNAAGLRLDERFGDFEGGRFTAESANQVCVARPV